MKAKIVAGIFLTFILGAGVYALAQEETIVFPVAELGNCESKEGCKAYCNITENAEKCIAFAEVHKLISAEDAKTARKIGVTAGPGGCRGEECRTYCEAENHFEECIAFAEK
ncbi:MAG: hypothetical protein AAB513_01405, partial [Patescibacteria group bacterium]